MLQTSLGIPTPNFCRCPVTFPAHMIVMIIWSTFVDTARFFMTVSSSAAICLTVLLPVDPWSIPTGENNRTDVRGRAPIEHPHDLS